MSLPLIIITGGTSGIGLAIAKKLSSHYELALIFKNNKDRAQQALASLKNISEDSVCRTYQCDIGNFNAAQEVYKRIVADSGKTPFALVNSAGLSSREFFVQEEVSKIDEIMATNLMGSIYMTKLVVKDMYKNKLGKVINLSSIASAGGYLGLAVYGASKAAIDAFSASLASEVGHRNIQVNTLRPGIVRSQMTKNLNNDVSINPPYGSFIEPEAVAEMAFYLIDNPQANVMNGSSITIDGGSSNFRTQVKLSDYDLGSKS